MKDDNLGRRPGDEGSFYWIPTGPGNTGDWVSDEDLEAASDYFDQIKKEPTHELVEPFHTRGPSCRRKESTVSRIPKRIQRPEVKAEGDIHVPGYDEPVPYDTQLAGPDGVALHLWMGSRGQDSALRAAAVRIAHYHRDVVEVTYSIGLPVGYWAHQDMRMDPA